MPLSNDQIQAISLEVIKTLYSRFEKFPVNAENNRNAPFHKAFLNAFSDKLEGKVSDIPFFISLSSWLHGLNTTLGQSFFENVAHILSGGQKKSFTKKTTLLKITTKQKENIAQIITDLKNGNKKPDLEAENKLIFINEGEEIEANAFTVDVFIQDDNSIICIELKTVKPNAGEMRGEKQKILEAKAALYHTFPNKKIEYYMGFPFDPTSETDTGYDKERFLAQIIDSTKYFDTEEILLAGELWNFLSSRPQTMEELLKIINNIAKPDFMDKYNKLTDATIPIEEKIKILSEWNIYTEIKILKNGHKIKNLIENNGRLKRLYHSDIFQEGKYNWRRANALLQILNKEV